MTMKNESGRSMVEMLGVLAIIGVLSIGGIAGYTMAMNRYRANEIIDAASKISVIAMTNSNTTAKDVADLGDIGSPTVPCVTAMSGDADGVVDVTLDGNCSGIGAIIGSVAGTKATNCSDNACTLSFAS